MNVTTVMNKVMTIDQGISQAINAEAKCKDILLGRTATEMNANFTLSSLPRNAEKPGLKLLDPAFKQLVRAVANMPSKAVDWFREMNLGTEMAASYNKVAQTLGDSSKLKFRLYTPEEHKTTCFAVVTEHYQEFPKSQILEAIKCAMGEWTTGGDLTLGIPGLRNNGKFGETIINPWELKAIIPMSTFTGPRGDKYHAGMSVRERSDGTAGCVLEMFLFRELCSNGLTQDKFSHTISVSHRGKGAWTKLQREIRKGTEIIARNLHRFQESIEMLPTIQLENPFAALVAVAEKDLGERRVLQARSILDAYIKEMGSTAEAVVNTITHLGARDKVDSIREEAQALGGKVLALTGPQWERAQGRGQDILQNRFSDN